MIKAALTFFPYLVWLLELPCFVRRTSSRAGLRLAWAAVTLAFASKFVIFHVLGGDAFAPELPEKLIWLLGFAYSGFMVLLPLSLLACALRWRGWKLAPVVAAAWTISAVGTYNGIRPPEVREVTLAFDGLPDGLDGYRIVQVSDLHVSSAARRWRTERVVATVNALNADLICLTGDYVDGSCAAQADNVEPIRQLRARDGVFAVTGNHEYYHGRSEWKQQYEAWGLRFLDNECVFPRPGLALGGVSDLAAVRCDEKLPDADAAFRSATNGEFRVLMEHRPAYAITHDDRIGLQLSGHTHGGVMPLMNMLVAAFNGGFVRGLYVLKPARRMLYVSPGSGQWAGFPVRLFNPTEIAVITLRRIRS